MFEINQAAPAIERYRVVVNAPVDAVFETLTDFPRWPEWQRDVSRASSGDAGSELAEGSEFRWTSRGTRIRSTIELLEAPNAIGWSGKAVGTHAVHIWRLEPQGAQTVVTTEESMHGWLPAILKGPTRRALHRGLVSAAEGLKSESERRQGS